MAKIQTVWGIDIGNTSLKALRCRLAEEPGKVEALACDFIEHSKVLSQPGTNAAEVLAETLQTFLGRNVTKGDRIAISVAGQSTISRFLPLPPVDPKKVPDVIRYEAKQWLPFDLNDVIFDFQPLSKPVQDTDDDTLVNTTVGMFAIKRDVASKALAPYLSQSVDIDTIQSSPIALYNFVAFDQLPPPHAEKAEDNAPSESLITLCIGTDATDVVITNGETIWIRNIPLGGNSFTKALTRELQLTFSKAEYLKRNITISKDVEEQKRVITAMRPVFNDMVNEINRSLEYYQTLNRKAKFQKIIVLGNAAKLPGLRQFVSQNLGYEVVRLNTFNNLIGAEVTETQLYRDNLYSFAVCYGLALQQLGVSSLKTNLIPREVIVNRIIREKKPWMLAAAASLLLGITIQFAGVSSAHNSVINDAYKQAETKAKSAQDYAAKMKSGTTAAITDFNTVDAIGKQLTSNVEGRITWLELLRAINVALPQSQPEAAATRKKPATSENFAKRDEVFIDSIEAISVNSLSDWFAPLKAANRYWPDDEELKGAAPAGSGALGSGTSGGGTTGRGALSSGTSGGGTTGRGTLGSGTSGSGTTGSTATTTPTPTAEHASEEGESTTTTTKPLTEAERYARVTGPGGSGSASSGSSSLSSTGSGSSSLGSSGSGAASSGSPKVVQIVGKHYHNPKNPDELMEDGGEAYLRKTLLRYLKFAEVELPPTLEEQKAGTPSKKVSMKDLGISYPVLLYAPKVVEEKIVNPDLPPEYVPAAQAGINTVRGGGMMGGGMDMQSSSTRGSISGGMGQSMQMPLEEIQRRTQMEPVLTVRRFDFVIQFAWEETPPSKRKLKDEGGAAAKTGTTTSGATTSK